MSYSTDPVGVRHGAWAVTEKYAIPSLSGFCPFATSCGASEVAPRYFRSASRSSGKLTHPDVTDTEQFGTRPLRACSSKPATVDWTRVWPEPWSTCLPLSESNPLCTRPPESANDDG